jgi:hypothetical protein
MDTANAGRMEKHTIRSVYKQREPCHTKRIYFEPD